MLSNSKTIKIFHSHRVFYCICLLFYFFYHHSNYNLLFGDWSSFQWFLKIKFCCLLYFWNNNYRYWKDSLRGTDLQCIHMSTECHLIYIAHNIISCTNFMQTCTCSLNEPWITWLHSSEQQKRRIQGDLAIYELAFLHGEKFKVEYLLNLDLYGDTVHFIQGQVQDI